MTITSCYAMIETLRRLELLAPDQLLLVIRAARLPRATPRSLARGMLQRGWLTVFQINQMLAGHGRNLVFGPYHVLDRIGQGGQSTVFKARHTTLEWIVALKVIRAELLASSETRQQFLQEMEAMAGLNHENIVQFCDADQAGDTYYCAMEYLAGTDLGKVVGLSGPLPAHQAADYVRQTALGLQHAHEHSLIHRDIKPVNLYLTADPPGPTRIKILDWGLVGLRPPGATFDTAEMAKPTTGVLGTADYLSPEQAVNPQAVDIRADIYSLGCTLYFLLTGRPPFPGGTLVNKLLRHQHEDPPAVDAICPDVPVALAAIVRRMMAKRPQDRYQTPAAVALALTPFCRMMPAPVGKSSGSLRLPAAHRRGQDDTPMPTELAENGPSDAPNSTLVDCTRKPRAANDSTCQ
jgi:eukaryotic-like serine/threonine-protein kinase